MSKILSLLHGITSVGYAKRLCDRPFMTDTMHVMKSLFSRQEGSHGKFFDLFKGKSITTGSPPFPNYSSNTSIESLQLCSSLSNKRRLSSGPQLPAG